MTKIILVVEDSILIIQIISTVLRSRGFEVLEARNGYEAMNFLDGRRIDMVITDLIMPVMNGLEVVRAVRSTSPYQAIPVLMLTTRFDAKLKSEGRDAGVTCWMTKPFRPEYLTTTIRRILGLE
jgi:two-component system, chemotaxis family, chemotaxis protein CheY